MVNDSGDPGSGVSKRHEIEAMPRKLLEQRFYELEEMLTEFQDSSKDLEKALEEELVAEEKRNQKLTDTLLAKDKQLQQLKQDNKRINGELIDTQNELNSKVKLYEDQLNTLRLQLVSVEINNDYMESNDRVLTNKLDLANQFNNELLEKLAITENDLEFERKINLEHSLHVTNYQNDIQELNSKIKALESRSSTSDKDEVGEDDFESTFLTIREVLRNGPPGAPGTPRMPKSSSLHKIHDLTLNFLALNEKFDNWNNALYLIDTSLKSSSTTHTTLSNGTPSTSLYSGSTKGDNASILSSSSISSSKKGISPSPSMLNLSEKIANDGPTKSKPGSLSSKSRRHSYQQKRSSTLEPIEGSPTCNKIRDLNLTRRSSKKSVPKPLQVV